MEERATAIIDEMEMDSLKDFWTGIISSRYENVKDRLFFRVVNTETSAAMILRNNFLHKEILNVLLVPYLRGPGSRVAITENVSDMLGCPSIEKMLDDAVANRGGDYGWGITSMADVIRDVAKDEPTPEMSGTFVIGNNHADHSAYPVFHEGVQSELYRRFGPYVLLPSSVNEMLLIPGVVDNVMIHRYIDMVCDINLNEDVMRPEDVLCNGIYTYANPDIGLQYHY